MKPTYSIDELEDLLGQDALEIADGLKACGIPMIYNGAEADLSAWYARRVSVSHEGAVRVISRKSSLPSESDVKISSDKLPDSWKAAIQSAEKPEPKPFVATTQSDSSKPDWTYWANLAVVPFREVCVLSINADPNKHALSQVRKIELDRRVAITKNHIGGNLPAHPTEHDQYYGTSDPTGVVLTEFRAWAESLPQPFTFPDEFPRAQVVPQLPSAPASRWPWGDHETELLRVFAEAGKRFWSNNYDPADPTSADTNETVAQWVQTQEASGKKVSKHIAKVMATILRANGLPDGRR